MSKGSSSARRVLRDPGARLFCVFWGSLAAVDLATLLRAPRAVTVLGVVVVVAVGSWRQGAPAGLAAAVIGWLFVNGFVENSLGALHWRGPADLVVLLLVVAAESVAARCGIDGFLTREPRGGRAARVRSNREARSPVRLGQ